MTTPTDHHTGWTCEAGATLIAEAMTPGPGALGSLRAVIYTCAGHRVAAEDLITAADYTAEVRDAPAAHRHDPWPCGHITAYDAQAVADLAAAARSAAWQQASSDEFPPELRDALRTMSLRGPVVDMGTGQRVAEDGRLSTDPAPAETAGMRPQVHDSLRQLSLRNVPTGPVRERPRSGEDDEDHEAVLRSALRAAGLQLGEHDDRIVDWVAGWEWSTVATIASWIVRAAAD